MTAKLRCKMCIREERTGLSFLTEDDGSSGYVCPRCKFGEECRRITSEKQTLKGNSSLNKFIEAK